jgi:hypothetical protein
MIDIDDVLYLDGLMFVVRLVAVNTYVLREYLGSGQLGGYENIRKDLVEFNRTLEFVGTWDEENQQVIWNQDKISAPPENVRSIYASKKRDVAAERKEHNARVIDDYQVLKGKK